jgi:hypothetical protein
MDINWLQKEDFWKYVAVRHDMNPCPPDFEFGFSMPFYLLRSLIPGIEPNETPVDEGDFPGPVARWYARVDGRCFPVTCHTSGEPPPSVVVACDNSVGATGVVMKVIGVVLESLPDIR